MNPAIMIKEARQRKNWTQSQLAEVVGVTPSFVTKLEKGESFPSYERCMAMANVLGLSPEELWSQVEREKTLAFQKRIRTRGVAVRGAIGMHGLNDKTLHESFSSKMRVEDIASALAEDPDLQTAFRDLKTALADPRMRETVLNTLNAFANSAKSGT